MEKPIGKKSGLILARKIGQSVMLYTSEGEIEIKLVQRQGNYVRLFFEVPESITVLRKELHDANKQRSSH